MTVLQLPHEQYYHVQTWGNNNSTLGSLDRSSGLGSTFHEDAKLESAQRQINWTLKKGLEVTPVRRTGYYTLAFLVGIGLGMELWHFCWR